jgi:hypothetical protein
LEIQTLSKSGFDPDSQETGLPRLDLRRAQNAIPIIERPITTLDGSGTITCGFAEAGTRGPNTAGMIAAGLGVFLK